MCFLLFSPLLEIDNGNDIKREFFEYLQQRKDIEIFYAFLFFPLPKIDNAII